MKDVYRSRRQIGGWVPNASGARAAQSPSDVAFHSLSLVGIDWVIMSTEKFGVVS